MALTLGLLATAGADPVKIVFLPPPMEGNLSLGVYDTAGTLVRVLNREAEWSEFTAADDGLATQWDGKDDHGAVCPSGTYRMRGVAVGDLGVEGVGFIGNDWVTSDDSPHLSRITGLATKPDGMLVISATMPGPSAPAYYAVTVKPAAKEDEDVEVQLTPEPGLPTAGQSPKGTAKANTTADKLLKLVIKAADLHNVLSLAVSPTGNKLYVLYENADLQRLSGYDFTGVKPGSAPKVLFENDIVLSDRYEQVAAELKFPDGKPFTESPVLSVELQPNPLAGNKPGTLLVRAAVDKGGAYLAAADGLPLCHISDTKAVAWAVLGRPANSKAITVFDSDGAVVEQFQVSKIANMMTFDAGTVQWTAPAATPTPAPTPSATPSASPMSVPPSATSASSPALP